MASFAMILLTLLSILLTLVILIQRGRGAGLAGAFGGGGQSAFGTKAGDVFTKITIVLITIWVILAGVTGRLMRSESQHKTDPVADKSKNDEADKKPSSTPSDAFGEGLQMPEINLPDVDKAPAEDKPGTAEPASKSGLKPEVDSSATSAESDSKVKEPAPKIDPAAKPKGESTGATPATPKVDPAEKPVGEAVVKPKVESPAKE